jgi:hypothetical protein
MRETAAPSPLLTVSGNSWAWRWQGYAHHHAV